MTFQKIYSSRIASAIKKITLTFLCLVFFSQTGFCGSCSGSTALTLNAAAVSGTVTSGSTLTSYFSNGCAVPDPTCSCNKYDAWYNFTTTSAGTYTITVKGDGNSNSGFDAVVEFRTNACNGSLTSGKDDNGRGATETLITGSLSASTTYKVRVYDYNCNDDATHTFTIKVAGGCTAPTITSTTPGSRCGTGTATLGATASAGTLNWYAASSGGSSLGTGTSFTTPSLTVTTTYYVDATSSGCTSARSAVTATVNAIPTITGTTPASRCSTGTVTLGATASAGTINWYAASSGGSSLGTGTSFTTPSISATTTYYVDATANSCTTSSRTSVTATVNSNSAVSVSIAATPSATICSGSNVTFTATPTNGGASPSYQWKLNGSNVGSNSTTYSNSSLANNDAVACVLTSNVTCPTGNPASSNTVTMTVNSNNAVSVSISASPSSTVCAGTNVQFTATPTNGGPSPSYQWKKNGSNVGTNSSTYTTTSLANGDAITCVLTSNVSCPTGNPATSNSIAMTINTTTSSVSATWALSSNANASASNLSATTGTLTGATSVGFVTCNSGTGWGGNNWENDITSSYSKYFEFSITPNAGSNLTITSITYDYNAGGFSNCASHTNELESFYSINNFSSSTALQSLSMGTGGTWESYSNTSLNISVADGTTLKVRVAFDQNNASNSAIRNYLKNLVISGTTILTPTISGTNTICNGQSTTLTASGGNTYSWNTGATTTSITVSPNATTGYTVYAANSFGCTVSATRTVTVNALPSPTVTASPSFTICNGTTVTLTASGGSTYSWYTGATTASITVSPTTNTTYTVLLTSSAGCTATSIKTITVNSNPSASITSVTQVSCPSDNSGAMTVTASGSSSPYTYFWDSTPEQTTATATGLTDRIYMITVSDAHGCSAYAIDSILTPALPQSDSLQEWVSEYINSFTDVANAIALGSDSSTYIAGVTATDSTGKDFLIVKYDASGKEEWVQTYNGNANGDDEATALVVDASDNVYVTGGSDGFLSGTSVRTGRDYVTQKYDKYGILKWTARYTGSADTTDIPQAIAIYNDTNIVVTGYATDTVTGRNYVTISYTPTLGTQQWLKKYTGANNSSVDEASSLTTDGSGNIYVNGRSSSIAGAPTRDMVTIKYDSNGDTTWVRRYADDLGTANRLYEKDPIAVDQSGNVFASGTLGDTTDMALIKYNSSGTLQWAQTYNGAGNDTDQTLGISVGTAGNIYVTGFAKGSTSGKDFATLAYNSSGSELWLQLYDGIADASDIATGIALDDSESVYITGASTYTCTGSDFLTIKYKSAGDLVWTEDFRGHGTDSPTAIATDVDGNPHLTGSTEIAGSGIDALTIKYNQKLLQQIRNVESNMQLVAKSLLEVSKKSDIKNVYYTNLDTAQIDSLHTYYYLSITELIRQANAALGISLKDSMNATLNKIYSTNGVDYLTSVLNGTTYRETKLIPWVFVPHLEEFDSTGRTQNPYIGYGFFENDYPLNGFSGISGSTPTVHSITRADMHSKPTWLVFSIFPGPPMIDGADPDLLLSECVMKKFYCNACNSPFPIGGITSTTFGSSTDCSTNFMNFEYKIRIKSDACIDAVKWNNPSASVTNYGEISKLQGSDYWESLTTYNGTSFTKKVSHPIRKYEFHGATIAPKYQDGDALTLCDDCNTFNEWISTFDRKGLTGMLAKNGVYKLSRKNQLDLYITFPLTTHFWDKVSPDGGMYFGTQSLSPALCGSLQKIVEDYQYSNKNYYLTENIFGYGTNYLASTDKNFIENFWQDNVITIGFLQNGQTLVDPSDILTFSAPLSGGLPSYPFTNLIADLKLNSNKEYTVQSPSLFGNGSFPAGTILIVYVKANFINGESINASIQHQLGSAADYSSIIVDIRGQIMGFNPNIINYRVMVFTL